jgi:hypothetical protein
LVELGVRIVHVHVCDVLSKPLVVVPRRLVEDQKQEVKPGQKGGGEVDVLHGRDFGVVAPIEGIGRSKDRCPGIQGGRYACLGDRNCLLLHDLVDRSPIRLFHLVELVDTADSIVSENEGPTL